ncbi:MAG TPA: hypothetical protein VGK95_00950 [Caldimonas sp.]
MKRAAPRGFGRERVEADDEADEKIVARGRQPFAPADQALDAPRSALAIEIPARFAQRCRHRRRGAVEHVVARGAAQAEDMLDVAEALVDARARQQRAGSRRAPDGRVQEHQLGASAAQPAVAASHGLGDVEAIAQIDRRARRETKRRRAVARLWSAHRQQRVAARHIACSGKDTVDAAGEFTARHEIADRVDDHGGTRRRRAHDRRGQASVESDRGGGSLR